jgi:hypothetical protein
MRHFVVAIAAAGLVLLTGSLPARGADAAALRWHFKKGQAFQYLFKHREVKTVAIGDQKFETSLNTEYEWQWTVADVDDQNVATLEQKLTALRVSINARDFEFQYDSAGANLSDEDLKKKLINLYDQLRFAAYRVRLRPDGRIVEVQGFDKLLGEVNPEAQILDYYAINLHDGTFGWFLQQALGVLPDKAVGKGGTWKAAADTKIAEFGQVTGQTEFTLEKAAKVGENAGLEVSVKGAQALELDTKWLNAPLRGTLTTTKLAGVLRFDPAAGMVRSSEIRAELSGDLKFGAGDNPATMKLAFRHLLELEAR